VDTLWSGIGSVTAALIGAAALLAANVYAKRREARDKAAQEIRVKKTDLYEELIDIIFNVLLASKQGKKVMSEADLAKAFARITPKIVVWASAKVIAQWNAIKTGSGKPGEVIKLVDSWEVLLRAIREDLGHDDRSLHERQLTRLFVNDLDEFLANRVKNQLP
jgi:hypothetical protein